ncbi:MAG TPA: PQQ-binding-like beta-propeller repeat protein [Candidatus Paceibacterota bacterium]|nr:PQQ-binding-like beta-propeller repeat protein [Verrucomicrobiota bacterium]HSA12483.1 PQQ-binding-like beta-propeller repeat protein [Candidatus Paceibacterota bacterium]
MKIQCSCGAKYSFDLSPDMANNPVRFVCPACGLDASDFVNNMIRQELGAPAPAPVPAAISPQSAPQRAPAARVRIPNPESAAPMAANSPQRCHKHPDQFALEKCHICSKPICPKCMELFGYLCSPLCKGKAEAQGIEVPVYAGQKSVVEARSWRRTVRVTAGICGLALAVLGLWFWYAWFGSVPGVRYSVRFPERSYSGQSAFCGRDQLVFLHGDVLARHDLKLKKEVWSRQLVDTKQIDEAIARSMKNMQAIIDKANSDDPDNVPRMPDPEKLKKSMIRAAQEALALRVHGQNIWVLSPGKLTRYDRDNGAPVKEIQVPNTYGELFPQGDELLHWDSESGTPVVTRINLNTGESRTERVASLTTTSASTERADANTTGSATASAKSGSDKAGLPVGTPRKDTGKVMDPKKVAEQAENLSYPARIALPAILAHNMHQARTLAAYDDEPAGKNSAAAAEPEAADDALLIPSKAGFMQLSVRLLERRMTTRAAMKAPPAKSVLDGHLTVAQTADLANEMLNEAQRAVGGDVVREDESRYLVTIRQPEASDAWSGEVIGPPSLYPLTTVNVLAANKMVLVLDKANKKLWQSPLSYNVRGGYGGLEGDDAPNGVGPCVERKGTLYVIDEGVLTAFDLATGQARWRLPSIGIMGLFFDEQGMIYANTTTAGPDALKYPNQIDITRKDSSLVLKLEPRTGKVLWKADLGGVLNYLSGQYIYSTRAYQADLGEEGEAYTADSIAGRSSFLSIKRINPKNGRVMWEHCQDRAPLDVRFDQNTIRLVFRKEVQVLRFLSL